jgi:hypothetical protein
MDRDHLTDGRPTSDGPTAMAAMLQSMVGQPVRCPTPSITDWLQGRLDDNEPADRAPNTSIAPPHQRRNALAVLKDLRTGGDEASVTSTPHQATSSSDIAA